MLYYIYYSIESRRGEKRQDCIEVEADGKLEAWEIARCRLAIHNAGMFGIELEQIRGQHGGKRDGAGRKKGEGAKRITKVVRVPESVAGKVGALEDLLRVIEDWRGDIAAAGSSPRWDKARQMMADIEAVMCDRIAE